MTGFKSPYVPGWDTHGLPTELKARKAANISAETNHAEAERPSSESLFSSCLKYLYSPL